MKEIRKKTWSECFEKVAAGEKTFEFRKDIVLLDFKRDDGKCEDRIALYKKQRRKEELSVTVQEFYDSLMMEPIKPAKNDGITSNLQRKVLEAKLRLTTYILYMFQVRGVQEETGKFLLCGEGSSEYYDLLNIFIEFVDKIDSSPYLFTGLIGNLNRFCSKVSEQVYCKVIREFSLKHYDREGSLFSWVSILHILIIEWYRRGMKSCGWSDERVSVSSTVDITLLELLVLMAESEPEIKDYFPIRDKDLKAVKSLLILLNGKDTIGACVTFLYSLSNSDLLARFVYTCSYAAFTNLYSDKRQPNFCMQFSGVKWYDVEEERVEFARNFLGVILDKVGMDLLKYRRLLLNSNGVTLKFKNFFGFVTEVHLHEVHQDDLHYIYLRYKIKQGMFREFILNIEDFTPNFYGLFYEVDYNLTVGVLCWLGLLDTLLKAVDGLEECYNPIKDGLKRWIQDIAGEFADENLHYCEPSWWNYKPTKSKSTKHFVEYSKRIQIATYSRKLPKGQQASESAKALAEEYCMVLESGYTLVGSFERKQKVKRGVTEKES